MQQGKNLAEWEFTAMQAAQKLSASSFIASLMFTAMQAAQKRSNRDRRSARLSA